MKRFAIFTIAASLFSTIGFAQDEKLPAFPGAEGFGRYVTGGRGGKVYHVTTLEDDANNPPEGSFRWACIQKDPRTIVFDVDGTIMLKGELKMKNGNVTIAGQTAPGDGVCIANYPFVISAPNVIIRFMRFRLGNEALKSNSTAHEGDGLGAMDTRDVMVDHCSVSWSIDECLSVYGSRNFTVQWCISSHSLKNAGHTKGPHGYGGNWGGSGASYHHNFMTNHGSRTPRLGPRPGTQTDERMDFRNNLIYNYGGNAIYGGEGMNVNIVNNYFKPGQATKVGKRIAKIDARTFEYCVAGGNTDSKILEAFIKATQVTPSGLTVVFDNYGNPSVNVSIKVEGSRVPKVISCPVDMDVKNPKFTYEGIDVNIPKNNWWPMVHKYGTFFVEGNENSKYPEVAADNWTNGIYNQFASSECDNVFPGKGNEVKDGLKLNAPIDFVYTTTHSADDAYDRVLDYVGASLHRDEYDKMLVDECREGKALFTGDKPSYTVPKYSACEPGMINSQDDIKYADGSTGWPKLESKPALVDTDGDGMPDEWEKAHGLNPDNAEDGNEIAESGYTNLEEYLNSLVAHIMEGGNAGGTMLNGVETLGGNSGIEDIVINPSERPSDGKTYNLMGIEVSGDLAPGIYIRDGKKFIVR